MIGQSVTRIAQYQNYYNYYLPSIVNRFLLFQAASIQGLASIYDVNIDLQLAPVNKIRVEGLRENVHQVSLKIQDIFRMVDKQARHEEEVQLLSQQVKVLG